MATTDSTESLKKTLTVTIAAGGTGYVVGDVLTIVSDYGSGATFAVTSVNAVTGAVESVTQTSAGSGYYVEATLATTTDSVAGADCTLSITAVQYAGHVGRTGANKFVYYLQYTKGGETALTLSMGVIKNSISTTTVFKLSPDDTATVAQRVFTATGSNNLAVPVTVPLCVDSVVATQAYTIAAPTNTALVIDGYPDVEWA